MISRKITSGFFVLLMLHGSVYSQMLKSSLFSEVDLLMKTAKEAQADVLSPGTYEDALKKYNSAKESYHNDGNLSDIKKEIAKASNKFREATQITKVGAVMFASPLSARQDARSAEADRFVNEMWKKAEDKLRDAAEELEEGNANHAKEKSAEATSLYRLAEFESIKANYLTNAKDLLRQADKDKVYKVAPKTMSEAKNLVNRAEKELMENRYDTDEARYLAKQAEYKVRLAMHIAKEKKRLDKLDYEIEDYLITSYEPLAQIGEALDLDLKFADGVDAPVSTIIDNIRIGKEEAVNLQSSLFGQLTTNKNQSAIMREQETMIEAMEGQMSDDAMKDEERRTALQSQIDRLEAINTKFEQVQRIFNEEDAFVFRQQNDIIIRLIAVNFDLGQAQIKQEAHASLTKLKKAIGMYDDAEIVIEGHTDSQGNDEDNLTLSKDRADAVLNYLTANTSVDQVKFKTVGFGESMPIANNETQSGRSINRRIDVVIKPTIEDLQLDRTKKQSN